MIKELIVLGALIGTPLMADSGEVTSEPTSIETTSEVVEDTSEEDSDIIIDDEIIDEDYDMTDEDIDNIVDGIVNSDFIQTIIVYLSTAVGGLVLTLIIALLRSILGNIKAKKQAENISADFTNITTELFNKFLEKNLLPALTNFGKALEGNASAQAKLSQIILLSKQDSSKAQIEAFKLIGETCANDSKTQELCSKAIAEIQKKIALDEATKAEKNEKLNEIIGTDDGTQI